MRRLNIVHVCDHLGWEGSRMHGVKRLFAWMIPRFDRARFNVSLVSLRKKDLSEDTLEQFGVDVTYLGRHKFDPATYGHLLGVLKAKQADVVHMHGYGATTFGRLCAWRLAIPSVLHEHANHSDTPWFQKVADKLLAPHTDLAIAVSKSTAEFTVRARLMPEERTKVVYLGVAAGRVRPPADGRRDRCGSCRARHRAFDDRRRHRDAADALEGKQLPGGCSGGDHAAPSAGTGVHHR